jgi:hypothetical protein
MDSSVHTSVGCVTDNGTWRWAMFATDQLQAHRGERAQIEGIGRKRRIRRGAQLQKRAVGNERRWDRRGARIGVVMRLEKGGAPRVVSTSTGSRVRAVLAPNRGTGDVFRRCQSCAQWAGKEFVFVEQDDYLTYINWLEPFMSCASDSQSNKVKERCRSCQWQIVEVCM